MYRFTISFLLLTYSGLLLAGRPPLSEAQEEINGFVFCTLDNANAHAKSGDSPEVVADAAMAKCDAEFATLKLALTELIMQDESINRDPAAVAEEAETAAGALRLKARNAATNLVNEMRASK